ncbi:MAG: L,D-transpeptidase family protein [Thermomicrobiales bacterium]
MTGTKGAWLKRIMAATAALALMTAILPAGIEPVSVAAQEIQEADPGQAQIDALAGVQLPPDLGQSELHVYVEATGHSIRGSMLDYWRANGGEPVLGNPISEPFGSVDGRYSQAFEAGVLQFYPEYMWTDAPYMETMPVGQTVLEERLGNFRRDGRRDFGGGDPRTYAWRPVAPGGNAAAKALQEGGFYAQETAHTVRGNIADWYDRVEGPYYLGNPLSQPVWERGATVQFFEGGLVMQHENGRMALAPIVAEFADALGINTEPVEQGNLPRYDESLLITAPNPNPIGSLSAPGKRRIEVSIGQQTLWAYQGETLVAQTLVSTGLAPNETELGLFHVRLKFPKQDMAGFTDETGEVIGLGDDEEDRPSGSDTYEVEDVPHVMYINADAEALHGAYWHNNFGNRMSHGCINLPLDFAHFLYGWAPLGTVVWVYQ